MGLLTMQMTGSNGILSVPSEHLPGLVVLVVLTPTIWVLLCGGRALAAAGVRPAVAVVRRFDGLSFTAKAVVFGSLTGALVHGAIVPTHWNDEHTTALLFIVDAVGLLFVAGWTFVSGRHWRLVAVAMLGGTAAAYALYIVKGWESADLVGVLTTTIELAGVLLVLSPAPVPTTTESRRGSERWIGVAAVPVALLSRVDGVCRRLAPDHRPGPETARRPRTGHRRPARPPRRCRWPRRHRRVPSCGPTRWAPWRRAWRWPRPIAWPSRRRANSTRR